MILLIDNYDSFSYNLYQLVGAIYPNIIVRRNDKIKIEEMIKYDFKKIILSPGPGRPENAGVCMETVAYFYNKIPILGVCLGHQAICEVFKTPVIFAKKQAHGKSSIITIDNTIDLFKGLNNTIQGARYHSLAADCEKISAELKVIAKTDDGEIMGVKHIHYDTYGIQFHPESVLTPEGVKILTNFINL